MKFSLCIHGKNAESYVHFPEKKAGKYSFSITEKERNILEALIETAQTITDGVYCADSYCTSSFQFRLFGDYGTLDYICISDIQDLCNNLYVARDFILMLNNKYCIEENIISLNYSNPYIDDFYKNEAIKNYYTPPAEPDE